MPDLYLKRILPHIKDTFNDAEIHATSDFKYAEIKNLNHNFVLTISDLKANPDDNFGFVKLKVPVESYNINYDQLTQFATTMNHIHRGCHWGVDILADEKQSLYLYATLITELGRRNDDKEQIVMEILNLQKMKYHTDQFLIDYKHDYSWLQNFKSTHDKSVIACLAPENYLNPENSKIYYDTLLQIQNLNYRIQKITPASFKITNTNNTISILTFMGPELVSLYSVITEENHTVLNLGKILNEYNQDILMGHFEPSPIPQIIGYTNYLRLSEGLRDIKLRVFLDSPDIARIQYFENQSSAA